MEKDACLKCQQVLEDMALECPRCGTPVVYCSACGRSITPEVKLCPHCNQVNLEYAGPAPAKAPEVTPGNTLGETGAATPSELDSPPRLPASPVQTPADRRFAAPPPVGVDPGLRPGSALLGPDALEALAVDQPASWEGGLLAQSPGLGAGPLLAPSLPDLAGGAGLLPGAVGVGLDALEPLNDMLGDAGSAAGDAPFVIEINEGLRFEPNNHGVVQLRLRSRTLPPRCAVTICLKAGPALGLQAQAPLTLETKTAAEVRILDSWPCRPNAAGNIPFQVVVEAFSAAAEPLGCWQGSHVARVGRIEAVKEVHIGGDLVDISSGGGGDLAEMLGLGGASHRPRWVPIPCYPEASFEARLGRAVPSWKLQPPVVQDVSEAGPAVTESALRLQGQGQLRGLKARIVWAAQAVLGREPAPNEPFPGTDFQIAGDSGRDDDRRRISERHGIFRLRDGRAWVQDVSRNGIWLNGAKLSPGRWHLLVPGDLLSLSQYKVANLKVNLLADASGVASLCLAQHTAGGVTCVILASRCLFWPATGVAAWPQGAGVSHGVWLVEQPVPGGRRFLVRAANEGGWSPLDGGVRSLEKLGWKMDLA